MKQHFNCINSQIGNRVPLLCPFSQSQEGSEVNNLEKQTEPFGFGILNFFMTRDGKLCNKASVYSLQILCLIISGIMYLIKNPLFFQP